MDDAAAKENGKFELAVAILVKAKCRKRRGHSAKCVGAKRKCENEGEISDFHDLVR